MAQRETALGKLQKNSTHLHRKELLSISQSDVTFKLQYPHIFLK